MIHQYHEKSQREFVVQRSNGGSATKNGSLFQARDYRDIVDSRYRENCDETYVHWDGSILVLDELVA